MIIMSHTLSCARVVSSMPYSHGRRSSQWTWVLHISGVAAPPRCKTRTTLRVTAVLMVFLSISRVFAWISVLFAGFRHLICLPGEVEAVPQREGAHRR